MRDWQPDTRPVRRISASTSAPTESSTWPGTIPAVAPGPPAADAGASSEANPDTRGLSCLDEPEAALPFCSVLVLVGLLHDLAASGAHRGDLVLVQSWRSYLADPQRYLRHVLD